MFLNSVFHFHAMVVTRTSETNKITSVNFILFFCDCGEVQTSIAAFRHGISAEIFYGDKNDKEFRLNVSLKVLTHLPA